MCQLLGCGPAYLGRPSENLLGELPHDDLAVGAAPDNDLHVLWVEVEGGHLVWRLKHHVWVDQVPEVPDEHRVRRRAAKRGNALRKRRAAGERQRHYTLHGGDARMQRPRAHIAAEARPGLAQGQR